MDQPGHPKVACGVMVTDLRQPGSVSVDTRGRIVLAGGSEARPVDRGREDRAEPLANPARQAKPQRLVRIHSDDGPMDTSFRFEPDREATRFIVDADYEMPGKLPGFVKDGTTRPSPKPGSRRTPERHSPRPVPPWAGPFRAARPSRGRRHLVTSESSDEAQTDDVHPT